jgi:hypothetical protein
VSDVVPIKAPLPAVGGDPIAIVPRDFEQVWRMATVLSQTSMVPKDFRNKPEETAAAIMYGLEIGLSPVTAVQSIAVINGRPSLFGDVLPALMRRHGHRLEETVHGSGSSMKAVVTLVRKDGERITRSFSMEDAKKAGLSTKTGPWQQYPQRMLQLRARSWAVRDGAAEILRGLSVKEELEDIPQPKMRDVTPKVADAAPPSTEIPDLPDDAAPAEDPPIADPEKLIAEMTTDMAAAKAAGADISEVQDQYKDLIARLPEDFQADAYAVLELEPPQ